MTLRDASTIFREIVLLEGEFLSRRGASVATNLSPASKMELQRLLAPLKEELDKASGDLKIFLHSDGSFVFTLREESQSGDVVQIR